jgi:alkaline phosphatase
MYASGMRRTLLILLAVALLSSGPLPAEIEKPSPRNVILMIADGAGYNTWTAMAMYEGSSGDVFPASKGWVSLALATYPLRRAPMRPVKGPEGLAQDPFVVYDPDRAWDRTRIDGRYGFAAYRWLRETAPDSANAATSLSTGRKTYIGAINVDGNGKPIQDTIACLARNAGMRVGVVTSVPLNHATPAAIGGAHERFRENYCALAVDMLTGSDLDLIAGCGHPDYDNNGEPLQDSNGKIYRYVGGREVWDHLIGEQTLEAGAEVCSAYPGQRRKLSESQVEALGRWTLVDSKQEIEGLVEGPTPARLLIVPRAGEIRLWDGRSGSPDAPSDAKIGATLQQLRGSRAVPRYTPPGYDPLVSTVPTLETMTRVALNTLDDGDNGLFLMVEGGAVDWAMHDRQVGRMIEEMADFKRSIEAVIDWIDRREAWDDTLLIVTSDHDHLIWGPESNRTPFQPLEDNGKGTMPGYRWVASDHTSALVPLHARGKGSARLRAVADGEDPVRGAYLHHVDVFHVMREVIDGD